MILHRGRPRFEGLPVLDLALGLEDLEPHPHLVDAVVGHLELGGKVRSLPLALGNREPRQGSAITQTWSTHGGLGEFWDPSAMSSGVRTFGIGSLREQLNEGIEVVKFDAPAASESPER